ncbi:major facilitator superfamily domain-containing protein [Aspergillus ambiguus]|uniref:MCT family MFS transporter n=1 Tax=Aspergillus ambiguus TaxID=176160 RepID=UPI003CCDDF1A
MPEMGTSADVQEKVVVGAHTPQNHDDESQISSANPPLEEKSPDEPTYDTGLLAWLQVIGSFFLFFNSWGVINTWGAFQTYYEQNLLSNMTSSSIAWIGSLQSFLLMLFGVVTGPLFDAGYFRHLLSFGGIMLPFGLMMTSISSKFWHLILAQGVCIGLAAGCLFVPSVALLPQYFRKRRGLANGIAASGSSIGGVIYPIMFNQLQHRVGFPWATRAVGFLCFGTCCISFTLMRLRFQPKEKRKLLQLSAFKEPPFVLFCIAMFLGFLGFYNFLFYVQSYAIDTGIVDANLGFYLLSMLNAGSTFGRIFPNFLADHIGPLNVLTPAATVTAILAFVWIRVHTVPGIIVLSVLYGLFSGGFVSLPPVVMASLTKDIRTLGTRLGMVFATTSIGLLIGTPIGGAIMSDTHQYLGVQLFTACCLIVSSAVFLSVRLSRTGLRVVMKA